MNRIKPPKKRIEDLAIKKKFLDKKTDSKT